MSKSSTRFQVSHLILVSCIPHVSLGTGPQDTMRVTGSKMIISELKPKNKF